MEGKSEETILKRNLLILCLFVLVTTSCKMNPQPEARAQAAVQSLKEELSAKLKEKIQESGPIGAIGFCNQNALPLTAKVSQSLGIDIRRISNKPRNPANQMSPGEEQIFESIQLEMQNGSKTPHRLVSTKKNQIVYLPIVLSDTCLVCHGDKETQIPKDVQKSLAKLYPMDKATGYKAGELRGLFQVTLPKN